MSTSLDLDAVTGALKDHYKDLRVQNLVYKDNPLLALMPKYEKFGGQQMPIPVQYATANRRSADFSTGKALSTTTAVERFNITRVKDYSFASIDGETIAATEAKSDAFMQYLTLEVDGALNAITRSLAVAMYGDGTGQIGKGTISGASGSGGTVTLDSAEQITNFEVGMILNTVAGASLPSSAITSGVAVKVDTLDRETGVFTYTVPATTTAPSNGSFWFFQDGDAQNGATDPIRMAGLGSWLPTGTPVNLFGVNRTKDRTRLAGVDFTDGATMPIEEALISAAVRTAREGGSPGHCFMNYKNYADLEKALGSKVVYDKVSSNNADIGFQALSIVGPKGPIKVIADQNCPPDIAYLLQINTWTLNSIKAAPHFLDMDGNRMLREAGADAYEVRIGFYGNVACNAPGYNCRIALA